MDLQSWDKQGRKTLCHSGLEPFMCDHLRWHFPTDFAAAVSFLRECFCERLTYLKGEAFVPFT